jgi:hypothetical protein
MADSLSNRTPIANNTVGSLVGEFMEEKRKERVEEKARQAPRKRNPLVIPFLLALCLAIWVAPSLMPPREPVLSPATIEHGGRLTLYLASLKVRAYHRTHQRLPANLAQAGVDSAGIVYWRSTDSAFELSMRVLGSRLVYKSTQPDSVFLGPQLRIRGIS